MGQTLIARRNVEQTKRNIKCERIPNERRVWRTSVKCTPEAVKNSLQIFGLVFIIQFKNVLASIFCNTSCIRGRVVIHERLAYEKHFGPLEIGVRNWAYHVSKLFLLLKLKWHFWFLRRAAGPRVEQRDIFWDPQKLYRE